MNEDVKEFMGCHGTSRKNVRLIKKTGFNERKYPNIIKVIAYLEKCENLSGGFPLKLRLIQVLEIAPTFLISQIREIRNKLEHEYILPNEKS